MKKRFIYMLLFLVPGLFVSLLITVAVLGVAYGALWLFVFGDSTWPTWPEQVLSGLMPTMFFGLWVIAMVGGYAVGKRLEATPGFDVRHVWLSLAATLLPIGIALLHQLSIGNLGPKSDSERCSEYCSEHGYQSSGMPARQSGEQTCICHGSFGEAEITVPIVELPP
ncbi:MAG: hypothetical protein JXJ30_02515 [Halothiobacillaceae bacterium]|nr:hypothetical protein [Halothiobacillaceae bacterium]HER35504.1 hypothetical protein [Halothiobacillaceae bacterium]